MLKIWLPLNRDLHNQGLDDVTVTVSGTTTYTDGKIGQCFSFNGSSYIIADNITLGNECSIACWSKTSVNGRMSWVLEDDVYGLLNLFESSYYTLNIGDSNNNPFKNENGSTIACLHDGEWHHFVVTFDGTSAKLYIDGEYQGTAKTYRNPTTTNKRVKIGGGWRNANSYSWNGMINDFRLYDESLTPKQIKEISKGLVLHYPLNRGGFGGDNLVSMSSYGRSMGGNVYPPNTNNSLVINGNKFIVTANPGDSIGAVATNIKSNKITISAKTTYTGTGRLTYRKWFDDSGNMIGSYTSESITLDNGRILGILNVPTGATKLTFGLCYPYNAPYEVWDLKVEEGSIATPWIPNSADALYSSMGLDNNIEYDVSGYQNNGTITGTLNYSSDTPKYSASTAFDGTQKISTPSFTSEIKTMSVWVKTTKDKNTSQFVCADSASKLCISFYKGCIISYFAASGHSTGSRCTLGSSYIENGWNHIVVVSTGSGTRDVYCNGVKLTPTTNDYWSYTSTGFTVGARNSNTPCYFYGYISDVRAYTTALSEDDVLELYHTPISITNNGTLMTQGELSEV